MTPADPSCFATWTWPAGCFGLWRERGLGSRGPAPVCDKAPAPFPESPPCPLGTASAALRWQRSGCQRTRRSNDRPPDGRSPGGLSGVPDSLEGEGGAEQQRPDQIYMFSENNAPSQSISNSFDIGKKSEKSPRTVSSCHDNLGVDHRSNPKD